MELGFKKEGEGVGVKMYGVEGIGGDVGAEGEGEEWGCTFGGPGYTYGGYGFIHTLANTHVFIVCILLYT